VKKIIQKYILNLIPDKLINYIYYNHPEYKKWQHGHISYSQEGEDMVLKRIFGNISKGCYVDIGAHHPSLFSNTNYFYQKGWRGINVEPMAKSKALFDAERPNDTNLELLVSENEGPVKFYLFEPSLMNTMSEKKAEENKKFDWCRLKETVLIPSVPLGKLLDKYLPAETKINFMSIDVEGEELSVLKSNNWEKYRPEVLLVEFIDISIEAIMETEINKFLSIHSYNFFAKTGNTVFYKQKDFFEF
jgi:FkbM family methyltransferase